MKKQMITALFAFSSFGLFADDLTVAVTNTVGSTNSGSIDLSVTGGVAPFTYSWNGPGGFTFTGEDPTGLDYGNYTVTVTDAYCGVATLNVFVDSTSTGIEELSGLEIQLYPNPAIDQLTIINSFVGNASMKIVNGAGEIVHQELMKSNQQVINVKNLASGIYYIEVKNADRIARRKFVKQ